MNKTTWREQLNQKAIAESDLIELEDHNLAHEYVKTNPWPKWKQRFFWAIAGILGFNVIASLATTFSDGAGLAAMYLGLRGTTIGIIQIAMYALFMVALSIATVVLLSRSQIGSRRLRKPAASVLICLIAVGIILGSRALGFSTMLIKARLSTPQEMGKPMVLRP